MKLVFKIKPAKQDGKSPIELILKKEKGIDKMTAPNTDQLLQTLDKLLKRNKIKVKDLKGIKLETNKKAGLTSQRITKAIIKALSLTLDN